MKIEERAEIEEKNVQCLHFPKRFKTNSNLAVHLKCKHPGQNEIPSSETISSSTAKVRTKAVVRSVVETLIADVIVNVERNLPTPDCFVIADDDQNLNPIVGVRIDATSILQLSKQLLSKK